MIVVDTSARIAIIQGEEEAARLRAILERETSLVISAGTLAEVLVVATLRDLLDDTSELIKALGLEVVPVTDSTADLVQQAYSRWGKGRDSAKLNLGDCFAYALAKERNCALLVVGNDFSRTTSRRLSSPQQLTRTSP
ncbi:type II toxin-antitoxin system VapC family toxin [Devosia nitrariae]|uniref:Ribonuclease VapC n=1 Tax=Devosia nitrariae TaxID=2071872 RepID=A0ABQ5W2J3_9HYPH|nr:type II toxin-antitoxin system VapC family toxin [Devosia nitrariae]GLQ54120.1 ribonuclease VapC [Devosia nitrariae]